MNGFKPKITLKLPKFPKMAKAGKRLRIRKGKSPFKLFKSSPGGVMKKSNSVSSGYTASKGRGIGI